MYGHDHYMTGFEMQNIPFDDDMNVTPPTPPPFDPDQKPYDNFPSAEGYEQVPADWKPRADRPLPALRCTHERNDGSRCKKFGVRGTGFNGTPAMCFTHGGSLPAVKKKAEATLLTARMRLVENTGMALDTLFELTKAGTADQIRLKASTEILDRAGIKGGFEMEVSVEHSVKPSEIIQDKLRTIAERAAENRKADEEAAAEIVDAEVISDIDS